MTGRFTSNPHPSGWLLWSGWLVFVVLPGILLWTILQRGLQWEREVRFHGQEEALQQEMRGFAKELEPPTFLKTRLTACLNRVWKSRLACGNDLPMLATGGTPGRFRQSMERVLGIPIWGMFWHGPNTTECWHDVDPRWNVPVMRRAILGILQAANAQRWRRPAGSLPTLVPIGKAGPPGQDLGPAFPNLPDPDSPKEQQRIRGFQRALFGDMVRARLEPWRVIPILSSVQGGGRMYMFYGSFSQESDMTAPILGGCLLIVRETDLQARALLARVAAKSLHPLIKRSWRVAAPRQASHRLRRGKEVFAQWSDIHGLHVSGRPREWFISLLTGRGSFRFHPGAERLELQVSIPITHQQHPLQQWISVIGTGLWLMGALGTATFLSIGFFGCTLPFRLEGKILTGAWVAGFLPIGLLLFGLGLQTSVEHERNQEAVRSQLDLRLTILERVLRKHVTDLGQTLIGLGKSLNPAVGSISTLIAATEKVSRQLPIDAAFVIDGDNQEAFLSVGATPRSAWSPEQAAMASTLGKGYLSGLRQDQSAAATSIKFRGLDFDVSGIGEFLARPGQIHVFRLGPNEEFFASLPITNESQVGMAIFRFNPEGILKDFFDQQQKLLGSLQGRFGHWQLGVAALRLDKPNGERITGTFTSPEAGEGRATSAVNAELPGISARVRRFGEVSAMLGYGLSQSFTSGQTTDVIVTRPLPRYPGLLTGWATGPARTPLTPVLVAGSGYFLVVLLLAVLLLGQVFQAPMRELVLVAEAVERGRYPESVAIGKGDEFGMLGTAFAEMVQGLRHRDELSHFVSEEVLEAVRSDAVGSLAPGGELMEVTVIFASLRGFQAWAAHAPGDKVVEVLNRFLTTGQAVFSRFGGSLDKLVEDTLMGVFRPRSASEENSAWRGVAAALALQEAMRGTLDVRNSSAATSHMDPPSLSPSEPACEIGVTVGTVLSGKIGSRHGALDFSVIGNAVNLAARLKAQAKKATMSGVLVAPATIRAIRGRIRLRFIERAAIKGRSRTFPLYEVIELLPWLAETLPNASASKLTPNPPA